MRPSGGFALTGVLLTAIAVRLSPLTQYLYWGADIGEYYAILRHLSSMGFIPTSYAGWGATYPYFPGVFYAQGALVGLSPLGVPTVLNLLVPLLGALVVLPVFLLGAGISRETKIGLFAAALVAVAMPHAYSTSHTASSTLGDLLVFSILVLFIRLPRDPRAMAPALILSGALVITHHLSAYFLILFAVGGLVVRGILRPRAPRGTGRQVVFLVVFVAATFAFWFGYATPFAYGIVRDVSVTPWWLILAAFPVLLASLAALVFLRRRLPWRYRPRFPDFRRSAILYVATVAFIVGFVATATVRELPGSTITLPPSVLVYFAPLYGLIAFAAPGRKHFDFLRESEALSGAVVVLVLSSLFGAWAAPRVLIPYRHIEYLIVILALFAGVGFLRSFELFRSGRRFEVGAMTLGAILLFANAFTAIPPSDLLVGWQEGSRPAALDAAYWSGSHVQGLLAADHRASTLAFGFGGVNATWDTTRLPFTSGSFDDARNGFLQVPSPSGTKNVTYVWLDLDTERGVQLSPWEPALPMSAEAIAKFSDPPFVKVFDNGYARIYRLDCGCDGAG